MLILVYIEWKYYIPIKNLNSQLFLRDIRKFHPEMINRFNAKTLLLGNMKVNRLYIANITIPTH